MCIVCWEGPALFPIRPPTSSCKHIANVCHACLRRTIGISVNSNGADTDVKCPNSSCKSILSYYDVSRWADAKVFKRYDSNLLRGHLNNDPTFIRCLNPKCNAGVLYTGAELDPLVKCYACGAEQCFRHQSPWHEGLTCDEYQLKFTSETENLTFKWLNDETKACPGPNCHRRIQKRDGCDHMTCKRPGGCGFEFCWLCLAPWQGIRQHDNSYHYDSCKYYSGKPNQRPAPARVLVTLHDLSTLPVPSATYRSSRDRPPCEPSDEDSPSATNAPAVPTSTQMPDQQTLPPRETQKPPFLSVTNLTGRELIRALHLIPPLTPILDRLVSV